MRIKRVSRNVATLVMVLLLVLIAACAPAPEKITPTPTPTVELGTIEIRVTDPGVAGVISAIVTAENISIHKVGGGWVTIIPGPVTFDLVELAETEGEQILGEVSTATANFTGIRMDVIEVVGLTDETPSREYTAEVPSGKLRIVRPFNVERGVKTILTLDFDLTKSLITRVIRGVDEFLFKPVVRLKVAHSSPQATGEELSIEYEEEGEGEGEEIEVEGEEEGEEDEEETEVEEEETEEEEEEE